VAFEFCQLLLNLVDQSFILHSKRNRLLATSPDGSLFGPLGHETRIHGHGVHLWAALMASPDLKLARSLRLVVWTVHVWLRLPSYWSLCNAWLWRFIQLFLWELWTLLTKKFRITNSRCHGSTGSW